MTEIQALFLVVREAIAMIEMKGCAVVVDMMPWRRRAAGF